jgi:N-6 DNA Methylase
MFGSTLSNDRLAQRRFDYLIANPPYGKDWKRCENAQCMPSMSALRQVALRLDCPRISDGHERTSPSASLLATNSKSAIRGLDFVIALTLCTGRESKRATKLSRQQA